MTTIETTTRKEQAIVKRAYQAFFSPPKYEAKPGNREILERGKNERLPFDGGELAVTSWGQGPAVLLLHGWGGARAQMTGFVDPLLEAGYQVVSYDQPAHGESDGRLTNILEIAPTLDLIVKHTGQPFEAIIAHSFGTLVTSYALAERDFPAPSRLIYLGAFNRLLDSLPRFQVQAGLPDPIMDGVRDMIYANFGEGVLDTISNESMTQKIGIPALMFHDKADNVTPIEDSRAIARVWESARLIETEGLGHRGALRSPAIHQQIVEFITG